MPTEHAYHADAYLIALNHLESELQHRVAEIREFMSHDTPKDVRDKMAAAIAALEQDFHDKRRQLAVAHGRTAA